MSVAMLLAAGRGERMRPLTDHQPKPLLPVHGIPLIVWQLKGLKAAGIHSVVINHAWLGHTLEDTLGQGEAWGLSIHYSPEGQALGTAGGIVKALPLLSAERFIVVSSDIYTDFDYQRLIPHLDRPTKDRAHLVLVDDHRVHQDFDLNPEGRVIESAHPTLTYGNIGVFHRSLFQGLIPGNAYDLGQYLRQAVRDHQVTGERFAGRWDNVGTPDDLARVNAEPALRV